MLTPKDRFGLSLCEFVNMDIDDLTDDENEKIEAAVMILLGRLKSNNFEDFDDDERSVMEEAYELKERYSEDD